MPFLASALDPSGMEARLHEAVAPFLNTGSRESGVASLRSLRESGKSEDEISADEASPRNRRESGGAPFRSLRESGKSEVSRDETSASEDSARNRRESVGLEGESTREERAENFPTPDPPLPTPRSDRRERPALRLAGIRVVRHKPGKRCLIEYDIEVSEDGSLHREAPRSGAGLIEYDGEMSGGESFLTVIGKVRARGVDAKSHIVQRGLWEGGFDDGGRFAVPRPLGEFPELHMWLQKKEPGTMATEMLAGPDGERLARGVAELAHELHTRGVAPLRKPHTMDDELRILHERLPLVSEEKPGWRGRVDRILAACRSLGESVPEPKKVPIHRDFYADQILVDGEKLRLLDFDLYCGGDPALDIGNFIAHVTEHSMRTLGTPDASIESEHAMEARFAELSGERVRGAVRVYAALTLARHIHISRRIPERRRFTAGLLELCEERLLVGGGRRVFGI